MKEFKTKILITTLFLTLATSISFAQKYSEGLLIGKSKSILPLLKGKKFRLQTDAYNALIQMKKDALKKGVRIDVVSSYRSFEHQQKLWSRKYLKFRKAGYSIKASVNKVKEYTAIPGTSRHHWGTEVDLAV